MFSSVGVTALFALGFFLVSIVCLIWSMFRPDKTARWPVTEGTIQSVNNEYTYAGRDSSLEPVGDFSYTVAGEYYSGRAAISSGAQDQSRKSLIGRKIPVRYNPRKPEKYFVAPVVVDGFNIGPHQDMLFQSDTEPTVLNIDKN